MKPIQETAESKFYTEVTKHPKLEALFAEPKGDVSTRILNIKKRVTKLTGHEKKQ